MLVSASCARSRAARDETVSIRRMIPNSNVMANFIFSVIEDKVIKLSNDCGVKPKQKILPFIEGKMEVTCTTMRRSPEI